MNSSVNQHKDLITSIFFEMLVMIVSTCNPSSGEAETDLWKYNSESHWVSLCGERNTCQSMGTVTGNCLTSCSRVSLLIANPSVGSLLFPYQLLVSGVLEAPKITKDIATVGYM